MRAGTSSNARCSESGPVGRASSGRAGSRRPGTWIAAARRRGTCRSSTSAKGDHGKSACSGRIYSRAVRPSPFVDCSRRRSRRRLRKESANGVPVICRRVPVSPASLIPSPTDSIDWLGPTRRLRRPMPGYEPWARTSSSLARADQGAHAEIPRSRRPPARPAPAFDQYHRFAGVSAIKQEETHSRADKCQSNWTAVMYHRRLFAPGSDVRPCHSIQPFEVPPTPRRMGFARLAGHQTRYDNAPV